MTATTVRPSQYLLASEVSEELRVPVNTLAWWRHVGRGPRWFKPGGRRVLYRREDLDAWIAEQYETTSDAR